MAQQQRAGIGEIKYGEAGDFLTAYGIGSCVAIVLYDVKKPMACMIHAVLPEKPHKSAEKGKYVDSGIEEGIRLLIEKGSSITSIEAKVFGGANMFDMKNDAITIGERNFGKVKAELEQKGIKLAGSDTGGDYGRTIEFSVSDKKANVKSFSHGSRIV